MRRFKFILFLIWILIFQSISLFENRTNLYITNARANNERNKEIKIYFKVLGPDKTNLETVTIREISIYNITNKFVPRSDVILAKYHIYRDKKGIEEILNGSLKWSDEHQEWQKRSIDVSWTGNGRFYVTIEFKIKNMENSVESEIQDDSTHTYYRWNLKEIIIFILVIDGIVMIIFSLIIFINSNIYIINLIRLIKPKYSILFKRMIFKEKNINISSYIIRMRNFLKKCWIT